MTALKRSLRPNQRTTSELLASLHERLAGSRGVHELAEVERRMAIPADVRDAWQHVYEHATYDPDEEPTTADMEKIERSLRTVQEYVTGTARGTVTP